MSCEACDLIKNKELLLEETENLAIVLAPQPATRGHVLVIPKQHAAIAEQVNDSTIAEMFSIANKISAQLFEQLQVQGTNLLLQNGLAAGQAVNHTILNVIPRKPSDGLNLEWQPKQMSEDELNKIEVSVKADSDMIGKFEKEQPKTETDTTPSEKQGEHKDEEPGEVDWMVKNLERTP